VRCGKRQECSFTPGFQSGALIGYEAELWEAANALRGSMDAAEYKHVVLGLVFLKYISDAFEECRKFLGRNPAPTPGTPVSTGRKAPFGCF